MQVLWNEFGRNIEILKYSTRNENDNTCLFQWYLLPKWFTITKNYDFRISSRLKKVRSKNMHYIFGKNAE